MIIKTPPILEPWYIDNIKHTMIIHILNFSYVSLFSIFMIFVAILGKNLNLLPMYDSITLLPFYIHKNCNK